MSPRPRVATGGPMVWFRRPVVYAGVAWLAHRRPSDVDQSPVATCGRQSSVSGTWVPDWWCLGWWQPRAGSIDWWPSNVAAWPRVSDTWAWPHQWCRPCRRSLRHCSYLPSGAHVAPRLPCEANVALPWFLLDQTLPIPVLVGWSVVSEGYESQLNII